MQGVPFYSLVMCVMFMGALTIYYKYFLTNQLVDVNFYLLLSYTTVGVNTSRFVHHKQLTLKYVVGM